MINNIIKNILSSGVDCLNDKIVLHKVVRYMYKRLNGMIYQSYSLEDEVDLALSFIDKDAVFIDGGANEGRYSRAMTSNNKFFDFSSKIVMIEPNSYHQNSLNSLRAQLANHVYYEFVALGAAVGEANLYSALGGSSLASLSCRNLDSFSLNDFEVVNVSTVDKIICKYNFNKINFLKLDLEGYEIFALKGAESAFNRNLIRALSFEFGGCNIDNKVFFKEYYDFLVTQRGFSLYRILPRRRLLKLNRYSEDCEYFTWQNLLACSPGISPKWSIVEL